MIPPTSNSQHHDFEERTQRASKLLGVAGRPIILAGDIERVMIRAAVLEKRFGLSGDHALFRFGATRRGGHHLVAGMARYRLHVDGHDIPIIKVWDELSNEMGLAQDFCVVPEEHYVRVYRFLRGRLRQNPSSLETVPIMREETKDRLWANSIGFLSHGRELLREYGVPQKRGLLLTGEPGNGKTMACRWLFSHCHRLGLECQHVRAEDYEQAGAHGMAKRLFRLSEPGIILFDDFDIGVRDRMQFRLTSDLSTFLSELDGLCARQGVVYLFTTNARLSELDPAFLRPGRIDQVIAFPKPDDGLRRRMIQELWHADIRQAVDVVRIIADTEGCSFAELDELKKLLVLHFLDTQEWDWPWALRTFRHDDRRGKPVRRVGFVDPRSTDAQISLDSIQNET